MTKTGASVRVAVLSGTGKTGRAITSALERRGMEPVVLGRDGLADPVAAMAGCSAAYLMAPNLHPDEAGFIAGMLEAAEAAGVGRIVYHSVVAPYAPSMPHHLAKAKSEDRVRRSGLPFTILQPCAYVENLLPSLSADPPALTLAYSPDALFGMVGLDDLAEVAAEVLSTRNHFGASLEVGGPGLVSVRDLADIAGRIRGTEVELTQITPDEWNAAQEAGRRAGAHSLSEREAAWLHAMFTYYDAHGLPCTTTTVPAILGRPARSAEQILEENLRRS